MRKILIGLFCLAIMACQSENKDRNLSDSTNGSELSSSSDTLTYQYDSVKVASKNVITAEPTGPTDTTVVVITFPRFSDPNLNKLIEARVCKNASNPDHSYTSYLDLANGFVKGFDDYLTFNEDHVQTWFMDINVNVIFQTDGFLALKFVQADYMGGAHPNSSFTFMNYDNETKAVLTLDSLLKPNTFSKLQTIAEGIFRKNEGLKPDQSLADVYFFDKDIFHLNLNFTLTSTGFEFLYNPYEIKPYAAGTTRLLIPYAAIKELIKPNSIIHRLNNAGI